MKDENPPRYRWTVQAVLVVIVAFALLFALIHQRMVQAQLVQARIAGTEGRRTKLRRATEAARQPAAQAEGKPGSELDRLRRENQDLKRRVQELEDQLHKSPAHPSPVPSPGA